MWEWSKCQQNMCGSGRFVSKTRVGVVQMSAIYIVCGNRQNVSKTRVGVVQMSAKHASVDKLTAKHAGVVKMSAKHV